MGEAGIVVGPELGEDGVGGRPGGDPAQAELDDEAILQGAPEPFDAALGLGGAGGLKANGEGPEDLAEVGGMLVALEFLRKGPVGVVPDEHAEAIAVEGQREAVGRADLLEQGRVAVQILGGPEVQGEDGARGIVDRAVEGHGRAPAFQPVMGAAVELDEGAHAGRRGAAGAVLAGAAAVLGREVQSPAEAAHRGPADEETLDLAQLLGGMAVIDIPVGRLQERGDPVADIGRQSAGGGPPPQAVAQAQRAVGLEALLDPDELADAQVQGPRSLGIGDLPGQGRLQEAGPWDFLATHRERLPCRHGVTLSLNS
jgi:hypothetical protein